MTIDSKGERVPVPHARGPMAEGPTDTREGALPPDTILVRAPSLTLRLSDSHHVTIELDGTPYWAPPNATAVLEVFAKPMSVGAALERLGGHGPEQFVELSS